jgi:hypothetical protein
MNGDGDSYNDSIDELGKTNSHHTFAFRTVCAYSSTGRELVYIRRMEWNTNAF